MFKSNNPKPMQFKVYETEEYVTLEQKRSTITQTQPDCLTVIYPNLQNLLSRHKGNEKNQYKCKSRLCVHQ